MNHSMADWEALAVFLLLTIIWLANGAHAVDWISAAAVFFGFLYAQLAFELAEGAQWADPYSATTRMRRLFILKEATWVLTFAMIGSWPLLTGAVVFMGYPCVRARLRANQPSAIPPRP